MISRHVRNVASIHDWMSNWCTRYSKVSVDANRSDLHYDTDALNSLLDYPDNNLEYNCVVLICEYRNASLFYLL